MKKLICLFLAALFAVSFASAETIETVETTIPLTQPDSPRDHYADIRGRFGN